MFDTINLALSIVLIKGLQVIILNNSGFPILSIVYVIDNSMDSDIVWCYNPFLGSYCLPKHTLRTYQFTKG